MQKYFSHLILFILAQLVGFFAQANLEVTCFSGDCLTSGWLVFDQHSGQTTVTFCNENNCHDFGWQTEQKGLVTADIECKSGGCFNEGWRNYNPGGRLVADVSCLGPRATTDCFQFGWTTFEPGRGRYFAQCIMNDCVNFGWDVIVNDFVAQAIRCKQGGCFTEGWIVYQ